MEQLIIVLCVSKNCDRSIVIAICRKYNLYEKHTNWIYDVKLSLKSLNNIWNIIIKYLIYEIFMILYEIEVAKY